MSRTVRSVLLGLVVCLLLLCAGIFLPFEILFFLGTGWGFFLARVVPGITVDPGGLAVAGGCLALLTVLAHSFLGWLYGQVKGSAWKVRWTASLVAGLVLMFVAGISTVGIAHQVGWLITSKEPWVASSGLARAALQRAQSVNNLKQIELGLANYETKSGSYPPGTTLDAQGQLLHGWQARILPQLEQSAIYNQINFSVPWDDPRNASAYRTRLPQFQSPTILVDPNGSDPAPSHYSANARVLGGSSARKLNEFLDGTAFTIVTGEAGGHFKPWGHPANWRDPADGINRSPEGFGSPFPGGANFGFADGSVRFLRNTIDPKILRALGTPAGGETIRDSDY